MALVAIAPEMLMEELELQTLEMVEAVQVVEAQILVLAATAAQASSSLPTHNSSHLWHLLMQVLPTLTRPHHDQDSVSINSRQERGR